MKKWILQLFLFLVVTGKADAIPNPSAVYCILQGYEYEIRTDEQGNQYGVCVFPDGSECGAWAYYCKCEPNACSPGDFTCHWPCKEMRCKEAGESVLVSKCCEGLDEIYPSHIFDTNCNKLALVGWLFLCSDCGNGICEDWESRCNCPGDCAQPHIIYVDDDATGANDGSNWSDAYNYLQDALAAAQYGDEIRVAQGIYKPDQGAGVVSGDRTATFQLINGVTIKGGYAGFGEPNPDDRNITAYETILSGDLDGNDIDVNDLYDLLDEPTRAENSYHVVTGSGTDETAVLDGFAITGGNDNRYEMFPSPYPHLRPIGHGAGMCNNSGSPTLANCTFIRNAANSGGGGMCNEDESSPTITNCTFSENIAEEEMATGGGMYNYESSPMLTSCTFSGNSTSYKGGGICNYSGSLHMTDCTFIGNSARERAGAVYIGGISTNHTLTNCMFVDNSAYSHGGAMVIDHCNPTLINCTFRNNKTESHRYGGGGILCDNVASPTLINCEFTGNAAQKYGGGMYNKISSSPTLWNCTFTGNSGGNFGGGICNRGNSNPTLINCIIWGNEAQDGPQIYLAIDSYASVNYSDVQGGEQDVYVGTGCTLIWGEGNIDADPCFAKPGYWDPNGTPQDANDDFWVEGDYNLKSQAGRWDAKAGRWTRDEAMSLCIDAGEPLSPIGLEPFPNGGIINMGTYGGTTAASKSYFGRPVCETIIAGDINGDCKINFLDFRLMALHWLEIPTSLPLPPDEASNPNPPDGATDVSSTADLSWMAGSYATSHDVYFGTGNPPPFIRNQTSTTFEPGTMPSGYQHFWRIDELNVWGKTTGEVWSFRIPGPPPPPP